MRIFGFMKTKLTLLTIALVAFSAKADIPLTNEWWNVPPKTTLFELGDSLYRGTNFTLAVDAATSNAVYEAANAATNYANTVAEAATNYTDSVATDIKAWTTNSTIVGYTSWVYSGDTSPTAVYSINMTESGGNYLFSLYDTVGSTLVGTVTTNVLNPTVLVYNLNPGTITASRDPIRRNTNGFAMYSDVQEVKDDIRDMDTSYFRFNQITNVNQSVQYVYTDANTTQLNIMMPATGMTKDWLVYVLAETNLTIKLPPATYWVSSDSVTNAIPPATPTALYFTQVTDDTYSIGRKEFVPITVETPMAATLRKAREKATRGGTLRYANTALTARKPATTTATTSKTATATKTATSTNKVQAAAKK